MVVWCDIRLGRLGGPTRELEVGREHRTATRVDARCRLLAL